MIYSDSIWVSATEQHIDSLQRNLDTLQVKFNILQCKTNSLYDIIETSNDSISNQLSSATFWLEFLAILIVIVGGGIGYYINYKKKQIEKIASLVEDKKQEVSRMAKEAERLDSRIRHNMSDLYKDLRKEETNALLDRLVMEPQDIDNLASMLFAREIDDDGYNKLKTAYLKLKKMLEEGEHDKIYRDYSESYFTLFYQHFFYQALNDEEISPYFEKYYDGILSRAYKRDIIKSTIDLCKALSEDTSTFNKESILISYLKALNGSPFSRLKDLRNIFEQNITPQTLLLNAIERCKVDQVYLQLFEITPPEKGESATKK